MATITYRDVDAKIEVPFAQPFVDAVKARIPSDFRRYEPHNRTWFVYVPYIEEARRLCALYYPELQELNREAFDEREERAKARREEDEARRQQAYGSRGYGNPQQANPHAENDPYTRLHVTRDAPKEVVDATYRALARKAHPDAGGSTQAMQALNAAYDEIKREKGWQ